MSFSAIALPFWICSLWTCKNVRFCPNSFQHQRRERLQKTRRKVELREPAWSHCGGHKSIEIHCRTSSSSSSSSSSSWSWESGWDMYSRQRMFLPWRIMLISPTRMLHRTWHLEYPLEWDPPCATLESYRLMSQVTWEHQNHSKSKYAIEFLLAYSSEYQSFALRGWAPVLKTDLVEWRGPCQNWAIGHLRFANWWGSCSPLDDDDGVGTNGAGPICILADSTSAMFLGHQWHRSSDPLADQTSAVGDFLKPTLTQTCCCIFEVSPCRRASHFVCGPWGRWPSKNPIDVKEVHPILNGQRFPSKKTLK